MKNIHWDVLLFILCMFLVTVDPPKTPAWLVWAWKGVAVVAAWGKGKYEDKPGSRPAGTEDDPSHTIVDNPEEKAVQTETVNQNDPLRPSPP